MKKLLLLFISATILSCSTDESTPEQQVEPILGEWEIFKMGSTSNDGTYSEDLMEECNGQSTMTFNEDGTVTKVNYFQRECIARNMYEYFFWKNLSPEYYNFRYKFKGEDSGWDETVNMEFEGAYLIWHFDNGSQYFYLRN
jgi:hypothetical protein